MEKLKACPWCGEDAFLLSVKDYHQVKCTNQRCLVNAFTHMQKSSEEAIKIWNTRKEAS